MLFYLVLNINKYSVETFEKRQHYNQKQSGAILWLSVYYKSIPISWLLELFTESWHLNSLFKHKACSHVQKTTSACFAVLRQLRQIRHSVPSSTLQTLVVSLVLNKLDFGNAVLIVQQHLAQNKVPWEFCDRNKSLISFLK